MKGIYLFLLLTGILSGCAEKNNIALDDQLSHSITMDSLLEDTTKVLNVSLPTLIDSANQILVHEVHITGGKDRDISLSSKKSGSYYTSGLTNLIFEDVKNNISHFLTNNQLQISSYEVFSGLKLKSNKKYILYRVIDRDYNKDGVLDSRDIQSLYISNIDGTSFSKITKDKEAPQNGEWIYSLNRYYFKTSEDTDNNGYFSLQNKVHYYYLQFDDQGYQIVEYNPLEILNK